MARLLNRCASILTRTTEKMNAEIPSFPENRLNLHDNYYKYAGRVDVPQRQNPL